MFNFVDYRNIMKFYKFFLLFFKSIEFYKWILYCDEVQWMLILLGEGGGDLFEIQINISVIRYLERVIIEY